MACKISGKLRKLIELINRSTNYIDFEVLIGDDLENNIFWDITPCSLSKDNQCFGGTCHLHLLG
jgi:hypothetical protein